jgi:hypothetical protein
LNALTNTPVQDAFWQYDARYNSELDSAKSGLPESMWKSKTTEIQQAWGSRIASKRSSSQQVWNQAPCWDLVRPGSHVKVTETRPNTSNSPSGENEWKIFAEVTYTAEGNAPIYQAQSGVRPLQSASIILSGSQNASEKNAPILIDDNCALVSGSVVFWQIPPLSSDQALALARVGLQPTSQYRTLTLVPRPSIWGQQLGSWAEFTGTAQSLQSFYQSHGFQVEGFKISPGYWYTDGTIHAPATWSQLDLGNGAYRLNESTDFKISRQESQENRANAQLQLSYAGCTAACSFLGDLRKQSNIGRFAVQNFSADDWSREQTLTVSYTWTPQHGWIFAGSQ